MTNHSQSARELGAPGKGSAMTCRVCGATFTAKFRFQQLCSRPCQIKESARKGWPGAILEWSPDGRRKRSRR